MSSPYEDTSDPSRPEFVIQDGTLEVYFKGTQVFLPLSAEELSGDISPLLLELLVETAKQISELRASYSNSEIVVQGEVIIERPSWLNLDFLKSQKFIDDFVSITGLGENQKTVLLVLARLHEISKAAVAIGAYGVDLKLKDRFNASILQLILDDKNGLISLLTNIVMCSEMDKDANVILDDVIVKMKNTFIQKYKENTHSSDHFFRNISSALQVLYFDFDTSLLGEIINSKLVIGNITLSKASEINLKKLGISTISFPQNPSKAIVFDFFYQLNRMYSAFTYLSPEMIMESNLLLSPGDEG